MASRETPDSRAQVLAIGRSIASGRPANGPPPGILTIVPVRLPGGFDVRPDRTCFLRSHYVLNAAYYLSPHDVLGLGPDVDAVISEYRTAGTGGTPLHLVLVAYPSTAAAEAALRTFRKVYAPLAPGEASARPASTAAKAERGWIGWAAADRSLAVVLDAPGEGDAKDLAHAALAAMIHR
jgi:hypothetical protein